MLNECLDLINTKIETKLKDKTLTENLKVWRKNRNITQSDYLTFVGNVLEELLEPLYCNKDEITYIKSKILDRYFDDGINIDKNDIIDAIQDIQVFCINETELMGYDNLKCNNEVFKHIDCRVQDHIQAEEWKEKGAFGKWRKYELQDESTLYEPQYEECKL